MKLFAFCCGTIRVSKRGITGDAGVMDMPVPAFLIAHPAGNVLFDTGLHRDLVGGDMRRLGDLAKHTDLTCEADQHILAQLAKVGLRASNIDIVVNSHLHYDHVGGNVEFPSARFLVQRREWEAGLDDDHVKRNAYNPSDYRLGYDVEPIDGAYDLFDDGSIWLMPSYGHTPGHQSLRLTFGERQVVLAADACYLRDNLDQLAAPKLSFDREAALRSLEALETLRETGCDIIFGHDMEMWRGLPVPPLAVMESEGE